MCLAQGHNAVMPVRLEPGPLGLQSSTLPLSPHPNPLYNGNLFMGTLANGEYQDEMQHKYPELLKFEF